MKTSSNTVDVGLWIHGIAVIDRADGCQEVLVYIYVVGLTNWKLGAHMLLSTQKLGSLICIMGLVFFFNVKHEELYL